MVWGAAGVQDTAYLETPAAQQLEQQRVIHMVRLRGMYGAWRNAGAFSVYGGYEYTRYANVWAP